jgi:hypothetical protein
MPYTINFLKDRQKRLSKQEQLDYSIWRYALMGFTGVVVVVLIVVSTNFYFQYKLRQIKADQDRLRKVVLSQEDIERSYVIFANKLKVLRELLDKRSDKREAINYFSSLFGPGVLIREIEYDADEGILSFGLRADSVFVLDRVFELLSAPELQTKFSQVTKSELGRSSEGMYDLKVTVVLVEKAQAKAPAPATGSIPELEK